MKISFTTLGCPQWNLDTICTKGREFGFDGVDFRGYLDSIDITILPEFTTGVAQTRRMLSDAGLEVSAIKRPAAGAAFPRLRGRTALIWTITGFTLLLLAYLGTQFVLEVVLRS